MTKTNYDRLENLKRIEKKIEKSSVNPIAAFDLKVPMKRNFVPSKLWENVQI